MQEQQKPFRIFNDSLIFSTITEFLTKKQLLALTLISKSFKKVVQSHCKHLMKQMNLNPASTKSSTHQMQFYFNRCLRIMKEKEQGTKNLSVKNVDRRLEEEKNHEIMKVVTIDHPFKFQIISHFQVGNLFSCYLTKDAHCRIFRTSTLTNLLEEEHEKEVGIYETRKGIRDIKCKSEKILLTHLNGEVTLISCNKADPHSIISGEEPINWTSKIPISKVQNSFNYGIFLPAQKTEKLVYLKEIFGIQADFEEQEQEKTQEDQTFLVVRNMLNEKYFLVELPCSDIRQCTVGNKFAYFITQDYELLVADFDFPEDNDLVIIKASVFQPFAGKKIVKVANGYNFYLALERKLQNLEDWTNERVLEWLKAIGFGAFVKIAKVEKLDGKKLKNIEKKYMYNVLGITKQNMQQKFLMEIESILHKKVHDQQLYGWGKNQFGQLGSTSANFIGYPQKIKVKFLKESEYIDSIFCGWFQTFIRTQKGRIYCTIFKNEKRRRKVDAKEEKKEQNFDEEKEIIVKVEEHEKNQSDEEEDPGFRYKKRKNSKVSNQNTKKKKGTEHVSTAKERNQKKYEEEDNWYESTLGKAFFVQAYKSNVFLIQCPNQQKEETGKVKKLRTAKAILDKILWSSVKKDEFKVGYLDKEMGLIEASAYEMEMYDVRENRVKYFKRNGVIIWDRENKIDILS